MTTPQTPAVIKAKIHIQAFGKLPCSVCDHKTIGKVCDYVIGSCGGYFTNCVPVCARCHKRIVKAAKGGAR